MSWRETWMRVSLVRRQHRSSMKMGLSMEGYEAMTHANHTLHPHHIVLPPLYWMQSLNYDKIVDTRGRLCPLRISGYCFYAGVWVWWIGRVHFYHQRHC